jgi:hypothetical protein
VGIEAVLRKGDDGGWRLGTGQGPLEIRKLSAYFRIELCKSVQEFNDDDDDDNDEVFSSTKSMYWVQHSLDDIEWMLYTNIFKPRQSLTQSPKHHLASPSFYCALRSTSPQYQSLKGITPTYTQKI